MKKLASVFAIALFALCANARMFYMELDSGKTNVLDRSVLQYGSAQLLGFECITSDDTGTYSCDVGKFMDAYRKVVETYPIYSTNITHVTDFWEYKWLVTEEVITNGVKYVRNYEAHFDDYVKQWDASGFDVLFSDLKPDEMFPKVKNGYSIVEYFSGAHSNQIHVYNFTVNGRGIDDTNNIYVDEYLTISNDTAIIPSVDFSRYPDPYHIQMKLTYEREDRSNWIEHWHNETNITQIGTVTNIYWDVVNKTCFCPVVDNASISNGISIVNLDQPINMFIGDSIKTTTGISDENPGIIRAIFRDDGGAIAADDKRKKRRSTDPTVEE